MSGAKTYKIYRLSLVLTITLLGYGLWSERIGTALSGTVASAEEMAGLEGKSGGSKIDAAVDAALKPLDSEYVVGFIRALINSLAFAQDAQRRLDALPPAKLPEGISQAEEYRMRNVEVEADRFVSSDFEEAAIYLEQYQRSSNPLIQASAHNLVLGYTGLAEAYKRQIEEWKEIYSPEIVQHPETFHMLEHADRFAQLKVMAARSGDLLPQAYDAATYAFFEMPENAPKAPFPSLRIDASQRDQLVAEIDHVFPDAKAGPGEQIPIFKNTAAAIRKVLQDGTPKPASP